MKGKRGTPGEEGREGKAFPSWCDSHHHLGVTLEMRCLPLQTYRLRYRKTSFIDMLKVTQLSATASGRRGHTGTARSQACAQGTPMPIQPRTSGGRCPLPCLPLFGHNSTRGPDDGTNSGISQTWAQPHPARGTQLWPLTQLLGAGPHQGDGHTVLLPQKGGERGQDVGTLVKNAGLATSSVICGGLEPEPRALVVLGRGRFGKEVQEPEQETAPPLPGPPRGGPRGLFSWPELGPLLKRAPHLPTREHHGQSPRPRGGHAPAPHGMCRRVRPEVHRGCPCPGASAEHSQVSTTRMAELTAAQRGPERSPTAPPLRPPSRCPHQAGV